MIKKQLIRFILGWIASSVGMYFCIQWFGKITSIEEFSSLSINNFYAWWMPYAFAGLAFSLVNALVKPLIKIFALPLAIFTMGISSVIINVAMVALVIYILPGVEMDWFGFAATSSIMSIVNGVISAIA